MNEFPHEGYRDELAEKLKDIRNSNPDNIEISHAKAAGYLDAKKETEEYRDAKESHVNDLDINKIIVEKKLYVEQVEKDWEELKNNPVVGPLFSKLRLDGKGTRNFNRHVYVADKENVEDRDEVTYNLGNYYQVGFVEINQGSLTKEDAEVLLSNQDLLPDSIRRLGSIWGKLVSIDYSQVLRRWGYDVFDQNGEAIERGVGLG